MEERARSGPEPAETRTECALCRVTFNHSSQAEAHFNGKKHQKKETKASASYPHRCPVCPEVMLTSAEIEETHCRGKRHTKRKEMAPPPFQRSLSHDAVYPMDKKPTGLALIMNNRNFRDLPERHGTDVDASNLSKVFKYLGFVVTEIKDQSVQEMRDNMQKIAQSDHSNYNAVVVAILTHGVGDQLYGSNDQLVKVEDLIQLFHADKAPTLDGKPKLFFLQACRNRSDGQVSSDGQINAESIVDEANDGDETNSSLAALPAGADILIAYATVPGNYSWRHRQRGSFFIQALCEVLIKYSDKEDLTSMMVKVNQRVATSPRFEGHKGHRQLPEPVVRLLKKLYFQPDLDHVPLMS